MGDNIVTAGDNSVLIFIRTRHCSDSIVCAHVRSWKGIDRLIYLVKDIPLR